MTNESILIVDDQANWRDSLHSMLMEENYNVKIASNFDQALRKLYVERFRLAIIDIRLIDADKENYDGLSIIDEIEKNKWPTAVIVLTGYRTTILQAIEKAKQLPRVQEIIDKDNLNNNAFLTLVEESLHWKL